MARGYRATGRLASGAIPRRPRATMTTYYVSTPIYYVNDAPHVGHAYCTVLADVAARWHRMAGEDVHFVTGTDEHGQKVMTAAAKLGRTPVEHADALHVRFKELWERLDIQYDDFVRTTEPRHVRAVVAILEKLHARGEFYAADYAGWYSAVAERFWSEEEVAEASGCTVAQLRSGEAKGRCPDTGTPVEWVTEKNWFFRMSAYQERLIRWIEEHPDCIVPESRKNEVLGYLRKPLADLCISRPRARLPFDIPLPWDPDYVTYVWFDALTNYLTTLGYGADDPRFARYWPVSVHVLGKDILTFHTVYWFAMLMAAGIDPPRQVVAHGWWLKAREKISKSLGNAVRLEDYLPVFGPDALRYFLLREIPVGLDGEWSDEALYVRVNADLANDLGNLAHRSLTMAERWLGGVLPGPGAVEGTDAELAEVAVRAVSGFRAGMDAFQYRAALDALWELVRAGNKYVDTEAPWALNKAGRTERLGVVLRNVAEVCRIVASCLTPVMPRKSVELLARIGVDSPDLDPSLRRLAAGTRVAARDPLFPRLELPVSTPTPVAPPAAPAAAPAPVPAVPAVAEAPAALPPEIAYEDFAKLALRIGKVLAAERHPNADKLLVLKVDVGEPEPRTIVAGIAAAYAPEELVGRTITVVANLKPVKLRGVVSQGMLLAAGGAEVAALLSPIKPVEPGTIVK